MSSKLQDFVLGPYVWDGARRAVRCLKDWYAAEEEIGEGQEVRVENSYKLRLDGFVHFVHRASLVPLHTRTAIWDGATTMVLARNGACCAPWAAPSLPLPGSPHLAVRPSDRLYLDPL